MNEKDIKKKTTPSAIDLAPDTDKEFERYQRQMLFAGFGPDSQQKLKDARVLVVGAGGLGSPVLQYLTGAGIGTIGITDADTVSISNLHRQILHPEQHLDMNKAESAVIQLKKLNSKVQFRCHPYMILSSSAWITSRPDFF